MDGARSRRLGQLTGGTFPVERVSNAGSSPTLTTKARKRNSSTLKHLVCSQIPENNLAGRFDSDGVVVARFLGSLGQTEMSAPFILPNFFKKVKSAIDKSPKLCYTIGTKRRWCASVAESPPMCHSTRSSRVLPSVAGVFG